jgi:hypothetical protein
MGSVSKFICCHCQQKPTKRQVEDWRSLVPNGEALLRRSYQEAVDLGLTAEWWRDFVMALNHELKGALGDTTSPDKRRHLRKWGMARMQRTNATNEIKTQS